MEKSTTPAALPRKEAIDGGIPITQAVRQSAVIASQASCHAAISQSRRSFRDRPQTGTPCLNNEGAVSERPRRKSPPPPPGARDFPK